MFIVLGWRMEDVHVSSFEAEHTRKLLSPDKTNRQHHHFLISAATYVMYKPC